MANYALGMWYPVVEIPGALAPEQLEQLVAIDQDLHLYSINLISSDYYILRDGITDSTWICLRGLKMPENLEEKWGDVTLMLWGKDFALG